MLGFADSRSNRTDAGRFLLADPSCRRDSAAARASSVALQVDFLNHANSAETVNSTAARSAGTAELVPVESRHIADTASTDWASAAAAHFDIGEAHIADPAAAGPEAGNSDEAGSSRRAREER